jgi:hypothetical protein
MDKSKNSRAITTVILLLACGLLYFLVAEQPDWGSQDREVKMVMEWHKAPWVNAPVDLKPGDREVMIKLLELDRGEIQYWEEKLFTVSFWINTAILAFVSFGLQKMQHSALLRRVCALGCVVLCTFYLIFVNFAEQAMVANDHDLRGIQYALKLSTPSQYLKGQVIYEEPKTKYGLIGHGHIKSLVRFNVLIVIFSVILLVVWLPLKNEQRDQMGEKQSD